MLTRFTKAFVLCFVFLLGTGILPPSNVSQVVQAQYIQLSPEQMKAALRCPTDESKQFVDDVYVLVSRGILPESIVISSFNYARKQPKQNQAWYYFQVSLEIRCGKLGINLNREIQRLHKGEEK